jgi:uncharacterized protein (TIGR02265 family)
VSKLRCEPQVRGSLVLSRLEYLRNQGGTALLEHVLAQLTPADAGMLRRSIRPASWRPLRVQHRLDDAIASVLSPGDRSQAFVDVGRAYADAILASTGRQVMRRMGNESAPKSFLKTVPHLYSAFHTAAGRREYEPLGENAAVIRTIDPDGVVIDDHCWTVVGCLQRGLELSGAETVLVTETACRAAGAPCCEYRCEWHGA